MKRFIITGLLIILPLTQVFAISVRIKDLARFKGFRSNQLIGYGLVVGLQGTGDSQKNILSNKAISNALKKFGFDVSDNEIKSRNIAAVMVTAELPAFARSGDKIDVEVSSIGDAKDISGGVLLQTPLFAGNGRVYAVAQGKITVSGLNTPSPKERYMRKQKVLSARVIEGGIVEADVPSEIIEDGVVSLVLKNPDITTANRIKDALLQQLNVIVRVVDPGLIQVSIPQQYIADPYTFLSNIENIEVEPSSKAKVIISERTGTVIIGGDVRISECAVAHNDLYLTVKGQMGEAGKGEENVFEKASELQQKQEMLGPDRVVHFKKSPDIQSIVAALNALGATPKDVIGILTAIYEAGAMNAELEVR